MTAPMIKQLPITVNSARKTDVRTQFAALCWRVMDGKVQILLITSRGSGRWIVPKGWPMDGQTPGEAALTEAWEEAGVLGKVDWRPVGLYSYSKSVDDDSDMPCVAMVYPVRVNRWNANAAGWGAKKPRVWSRNRNWPRLFGTSTPRF